jgi:hypothetical protein
MASSGSADLRAVFFVDLFVCVAAGMANAPIWVRRSGAVMSWHE